MTGWFGPQVLYFGDHVYSDLAVSASVLLMCVRLLVLADVFLMYVCLCWYVPDVCVSVLVCS